MPRIIAYRLLHVEDSADDAELVKFSLRNAAFESAVTLVETENDYLAELDAKLPDVILCDYDLPRFSAARALQIMQQRGLDIPFILVSHHIGESAAVVAMQQGASDYLPKNGLGRLPKAIESAIERRDARLEKTKAEEALRNSEAMKRGILNSLSSRIALLDGHGVILAINKAWEDFDAVHAQEHVRNAAVGANYLEILRDAAERGNSFAESGAQGIQAVIAGDKNYFSLEYELMVGASTRWYVARVTPLEGNGHGAVVSHQDVTDRMMTHIALGNAHRRMQILSKRVLTIQEEERRTISRELHDDVGQSLTALKIGLHRLAEQPVDKQLKLLSECLGVADGTLEKLRHLCSELRPPQLDQLGLEDALRWLVDRQRSATGLEIKCHFNGLRYARLPAAVEGACYRITQEGLSNATRHAEAKSILVNVESDGKLARLTIRDDGVGFDEESARQKALKSGSLGLISMEERAQLAGGRLKLRSVQGGGTTISVIFALDNPDSERAGADQEHTIK